jgi:sigma-E factor negative regulatory protein RseC
LRYNPIAIRLRPAKAGLVDMLTESARVIRRDGNRVELELLRGSACSHCELSQGCGTGAIGRLLRRRSRPLVIETDQDCLPGDEVQLLMPEASLVRASLLLYGLPLLGMLLAGLLATAVTEADWLVALAACGGLGAGLAAAAAAAARLEDQGMAPHIANMRLNSIERHRS